MSIDSQNRPSQAIGNKWVFDKTLNLPTLFTLAGIVVAVIGFGFNLINNQDHRIEQQTRRIDAVERTANSAQDDVKRVKQMQTMQIKSQADQLQTLRSEFRSDLKDISNKLDALLMNSAGFRVQTKPWTKK